MGIISNIKKNMERSGSNKERILYVKSDSKVRVRFLQELDDGFEFQFHDNFNAGINCLCLEELGEECSICEEGENWDGRTRKLFAWSVYNVDTKKVEIALFAVNQCTPVASLIDMSEEHGGTIMDRDYVLKKSGKQQSTSYTVIPQDKSKFRNEKAKPFTKKAMLKILKEAFPLKDDIDMDDDDDEPKKRGKKKSSKKSQKDEDDFDDFDDLEDDDIDEDEDEEEEEKKSKKKSSSKKDKKSKKKKDDDEDYAMVDDDDVPKGLKDKDDELAVSWMEELLEENDIDQDEFLEYMEAKSLKKFKKKTKKEFKKLAKEYIAYIESDDDDEDDE